MKKIVSLILCLLLLSLTMVNAETAEEERLVIAVQTSGDALQVALEEAFFKQHPNAVIEYRLYDTREQFEAMLMSNSDFDVAIVYDYMLQILAKKGYLQSLNELGINEYPQTLLDYEEELSYNGQLMGLPQSMSQQFWLWNTAAARKAGLQNPAADGVWTWDEYYELMKKLPMDTDGDGEPDVFLRNGIGLMNYPELQNTDEEILCEYFNRYPRDMERFWTDYFDMFKEMFLSDALLGEKTSENQQVLIEISNGNPNLLMGSVIPMPVFDEDDPGQLGGLTAWVVNKNAPHMGLAADFIQLCPTEEGQSITRQWSLEMLVSWKQPAYYIANENAVKPVFETKKGIQTAEVRAGRELKLKKFDGGSYAAAQKYRENYTNKKLTDAPTARSAFYYPLWAYVRDWSSGYMSDEEFRESVEYLINMALGE